MKRYYTRSVSQVNRLMSQLNHSVSQVKGARVLNTSERNRAELEPTTPCCYRQPIEKLLRKDMYELNG